MSSWYIWTDFGGVLTPPISRSLSAFCRTHGLDPVELGRAMRTVALRHGTTDPLEPLDRPLLTEAAWLAELNGEIGAKLSLTSIADAWFNGREANRAWLDVLREQRSERVRVGMLSNMVPAWNDHWRRMVDSDAIFEHVVLSYEVGFRKPESGMFACAASQAGVSASQCVLVDDLLENCEGATAAGWRAVHFQDAQSARKQLLQIIS